MKVSWNLKIKKRNLAKVGRVHLFKKEVRNFYFIVTKNGITLILHVPMVSEPRWSSWEGRTLLIGPLCVMAMVKSSLAIAEVNRVERPALHEIGWISCLVRSYFCLGNSVTRWLDYFWKFGYLQQEKVAPKHNIFAKVGSKFCLTLNKPSTIWQRFIKFCQSGEISQNLVTLLGNHRQSLE